MSFNDSTIEPKNAFLGLLINRIAITAEIIYDQKELRTGLIMMLSLIDMLDETSQKQLEPQRTKITDMQEGRLQKDTVYKIFSTISIYLHKTYLQEVSLGLIPASTLTNTKQIPDGKEAIPTRLSSRLS